MATVDHLFAVFHESPKKQRVTSAKNAKLPAKPKETEPESTVLEVYESDVNCTHECMRPSKNYTPYVPRPIPNPPAKRYPYKLDPFQSKAVTCLESGESVLVSAHTSAGKTTVAEYAIAMALRDAERVIYTSPIKALSNQKYRDLCETYPDEVGLLTGDVTVNPNASILIMTTEILRLMLYRGSSIVREVKWVIMDEIHYMRDRQRGVVWEESIIMLPEAVRLVFLSATIPNAREFADWVATIKNQPCHVIYTDYRPVPLQHYICPAGSDKVYLVMDKEKKFLDGNFSRAMADLNIPLEPTAQSKDEWSISDMEKLLSLCSERDFLPLICFSFGKKEIEKNASTLDQELNYLTKEEQEMVKFIFDSAIAPLGAEGRSIPQVTQVLNLVQRGIGIHHGGLLPVLKELVELLFQQQLIKVLFATETFSMGVNMPARTVIFTSRVKWDGECHRPLSAGEYIQMSGRAGRRGLDTKGNVILFLSEKINADEAKDLFLGEPLRLNSSFRLSYHMLLNMTRLQGASAEHFLYNSLLRFQNDQALKDLLKKRERLIDEIEEASDLIAVARKKIKGDPFSIEDENIVPELIEDLYTTVRRIEKADCALSTYCYSVPELAAGYLIPGRLIRVRQSTQTLWGWGLALSKLMCCAGGSSMRLQVLLPCNPITEDGSHFNPAPLPMSLLTRLENRVPASCKWDVVTIDISQIEVISQVTTKLRAELLVNPESKTAAGQLIDQILDKFKSKVPLLHPITHLKGPLDCESIWADREEALTKLETIITQLPSNETLIEVLYEAFAERLELSAEVRRIEAQCEERRKLKLEDDLRNMRQVLRKLKLVDEDDVLTFKGRAACEISVANELVVIELLFDRCLKKYSTEPYKLASLLCCFVAEKQGNEKNDKSKYDQTEAHGDLSRLGTMIADVLYECELPVDAEEFVDQFLHGRIMDIAARWLQGRNFVELGIPASMPAGSVVRILRRLHELLQQLEAAAKVMGDEELASRLYKTATLMHRGVVFSASLYL